ncbi:hypothetical protein [Paenibacillus paeoniae]|uniref:Beta-carotene 15,15'-monooxygenase n=1 Tax=Paenibacillus paeoniae TaxID=2292705 RepID=A0A371P7D3_9BACL|nr:hypothetical protein [Paenibacillus paeoniae]REK71847.1 hypothetical protein DX130_19235 [Paenibacillus paeoniae]
MSGHSSSRTTPRSKYTFGFGLAIFIVMAVLYAAGVAYLFRSDYMSEGIMLAAAFDGIVAMPVLFYMLCMRVAPLPKGWLIAIAVAAALFMYVMTPAPYATVLSSALRWLLPAMELVLVTYLLLRLTTIVNRYRSIARLTKQPPMMVLREALIPMLGSGALLEIVTHELNVLYYAIMAGSKNSNRPQGTCFTYHQTSQFKMVSIVFSIIIILETVGLHFLLSMWSPWAAWLSVAMNIYGILYLIAASRSMAHLPHRFTEQHMHIHYGFQGSAVIPLSIIDSIAQAVPRALGEKVPKHMYLAYSSIDTPQFEIRLKQPLHVKGVYGISKQASSIVITVDDPKAFIAEWERLSESSTI